MKIRNDVGAMDPVQGKRDVPDAVLSPILLGGVANALPSECEIHATFPVLRGTPRGETCPSHKYKPQTRQMQDIRRSAFCDSGH